MNDITNKRGDVDYAHELGETPEHFGGDETTG